MRNDNLTDRLGLVFSAALVAILPIAAVVAAIGAF